MAHHLKSIGAHKRRLLATCSAVVLGVFLAGTLVLGDTVSAGFDDLFVEANAGTDAIVRSGTEVGEGDFTERGMIDVPLADEIAGLDGVAVAAPLIDGTGRIVGEDGDLLGGNGPPTVAGNWITDDRANPYEPGRGPGARGPGRGRHRQVRRPPRATWRSATPPPSGYRSRWRSPWSASPPSGRPTAPGR